MGLLQEQHELGVEVEKLFEQWHRYETEPEYRKWWDRADAGLPSSARKPSAETTPPKMSELARMDLSPAPVPNPMAKRVLQASKRLEKEVKSQKPHKKPVQPDVLRVKAEKSQPQSQAQSEEPCDKKKKKKTSNAKKTKKRSHKDGPMQEAMKKYIASKREKGFTYMQALQKWRNSSKRASIVDNMSEAERKRRRYD